MGILKHTPGTELHLHREKQNNKNKNPLCILLEGKQQPTKNNNVGQLTQPERQSANLPASKGMQLSVKQTCLSFMGIQI